MTQTGRSEKQKILIVDDSEFNRAILSEILSDEYDIIEAADGAEAVRCLEVRSDEIALAFLDIIMPVMDGFEVLAVMNRYHWIRKIPVIMISSDNAAAYVERCFKLGAADFIARPFEYRTVQHRVSNVLAVHADRSQMMQQVTEELLDLQKNNYMMINVLGQIVEFRNGESGLHILHMNTITEHLLRCLMQVSEEYHFTERQIELITMASSLHDVGKVTVPDRILNKPGRLTDEEYAIMKNHAVAGARILDEMEILNDQELIRYAKDICRWHHERHDGNGYPDGLKGHEIPIIAQVVALADVYDALTSSRVYKRAYSPEVALEMIHNGECGVFSPLLLKCLDLCHDAIVRDLESSGSMSAVNRRMLTQSAESMFVLEEKRDADNTRRLLQLLEHERAKNKFYESMSLEVRFEYDEELNTLTFSEWGAERLGLFSVIPGPIDNEQLAELMDPGMLTQIRRAYESSTIQEPVFQIDGICRIEGEFRHSRFICRSMWSEDRVPVRKGLIGKMTDIHEVHQRMLDLRRRATHDSLTGLLNHAEARQRITDRICKNPEGHFALAIFDLDYFKQFNDRYGHTFGDKVLTYVSSRCVNSVRKDDIAARVGGDEFMIFLEYKYGIENVMNRIFSAIRGEVDGTEVSISMGISTSDVCGNDYETLFRSADQALYSVKREQRGQYRFYEESMKDMLSAISVIDGKMEADSAEEN